MLFSFIIIISKYNIIYIMIGGRLKFKNTKPTTTST